MKQSRIDNLKNIWEMAKSVFCALILAYVLNTCVIVNAQVPSSSMETTVMTGDRIIANRLSYLIEPPKRGDIVTFIYPDDGKTAYLKRIIGLPCETIEGRDGKIYINGEQLENDYTSEEGIDNFGPFLIPDECYFMMGDNRNDSWDSRYWTNKYVSSKDIIGKAVISYYPHPRILK